MSATDTQTQGPSADNGPSVDNPLADKGSLSEWKRHPDLYMPDGSVVLLAGDTLFKVYLHWLAKKSEVFADMVSFGTVQPHNSDIYDGVPLIRVLDDPKDMECFLYSLDACSDFLFPGRPTSFSATASILRLSSKYMVSALRSKAIDHLSRLYPTKFEHMSLDHRDISDEIFGEGAGPEHPILLVNLFRECNELKFMPWVYYAVIRWCFRDMILGFKCADDTLVQLSQQDKEVCLLGYESLMLVQHRIIKAILRSPSSKCKSSLICRDAINDAYKRAMDEHGTGLIAPLGPLRRKIEACDECLSYILQLDLEKRKALWAVLPSYFDLPSWAELLKDEKPEKDTEKDTKDDDETNSVISEAPSSYLG